MLPKISIITPSFNQGQYIEETILSVIDQNYPNYELIIVDGGSKDSTVDVIKKYEKHITYWISEPDKGQTDAILKGLSKCAGELFNWINSDDRLAPGSLHAIAEAYIKNNKPSLVAGNVEIFYESGEKKILPHINFRNDLAITLGMGEMRQPGMFYKTEVIKEIQMNPALHYSMDIDLYFRFNFMAKKPSTAYIDKTLAEFRVHENSKTNQEITKTTDSRFFRERIEIFGDFISSYNSKHASDKFKRFFSYEKPRQLLNVDGSSARVSLLNRALNYFFYENLMEALYIFDKKKIKPLVLAINWFDIKPSFTIRVAGKLSSLFLQFFKNKIGLN